MDISLLGASKSCKSHAEVCNKDQDRERRKQELKEYHRSLYTSEKAKLQNAAKLRIRKLPLLGNKPLHTIVIQVLNVVFEVDLIPDDILEVEKVPSWFGPESTDLVVTFRNEDVRNRVYNNRRLYSLGFATICDELGEERLEIWRRCVRKYGLENVYTHCGGVHITVGDEGVRFLTLRELDKYELDNV